MGTREVAEPGAAGVADEAMWLGLFGARDSLRGGRKWHGARRGGHWLALGEPGRGGLAEAMRYYRALRPAGRLYRWGMTAVSRSPLRVWLPTFESGEGGLVAELEEEKEGGRVVLVLLGNPRQVHRRAVLRMDRPDGVRRVVKAGFGDESVRAIRREAELLLRAGGRFPGVPLLRWWREEEERAAFATDEESGEPILRPDGIEGAIVLLLGGWALAGAGVELSAHAGWERVLEGWRGGERALEELARRRVVQAFRHGDFASWNLLRDARTGGLRVVDWEWAEEHAPAGLDLVHLADQQVTMVGRRHGARRVAGILEILRREEFARFLADCGWPGPEEALAVHWAGLNPIFTAGEPLETWCPRLAEG